MASSAYSVCQLFQSRSKRTEPYLLHNRQNPRLRIVIPVRADAQVDLLLGGILAIGLHQTKERVFGGGRHSGRSKDGGAGGTHDVI